MLRCFCSASPPYKAGVFSQSYVRLYISKFRHLLLYFLAHNFGIRTMPYYYRLWPHIVSLVSRLSINLHSNTKFHSDKDVYHNKYRPLPFVHRSNKNHLPVFQPINYLNEWYIHCFPRNTPVALSKNHL